MKTYLYLTCALLIGMILAACGQAETPTAEPTPVPPTPTTAVQTTPIDDLLDITWQWGELVETNPASQSVVPDPENYTLTFREDGTVEIKADCNQVGGTYALEGGEFKIELGPTTMAFCGDESLDQQYLALLAEVNAFSTTGGQLKLSGDNFTMTFNEGVTEEAVLVDPADLQDKLWEWERRVIPDSGTEETISDPASYTLTFNPDDTFDFRADCNVGGGTYSADENGAIQFGPGPITLAECGPESRYQDMLDMLGTAQAYRFEDTGDMLVLLGSDNSPQDYFRGVELEEVSGCPIVEPSYLRLDTQGLPYFWQPNTVPATPYDNTQPPGAKGLPEHIQVNFGVLNPQDRLPGDPIIYIIDVEEYQRLWDSAGDNSVTLRIEQLQDLLEEQPEAFPTSGLPVLPFEEVTGVNDLAVQGEFVDFDWFAGLRFVGRFRQDPNPVTDEGLFYIFNGFNTDGSCLISFFYPVSSEQLPDTAEDVPAAELERVDTDPEGYLNEMAQSLNEFTPEDWDPSLNTLDGVIGSLAYMPPEPVGTSLTGVTWGWTELTQTEPASQTVVPDPENYTLVFETDAGLQILADCNSGSGTYTLDGDNMTIEIGVLTRAECGPESLSSLFLEQLDRVASYELTLELLALNLAEGAGRMIFSNLGPGFGIPAPGEGVPTATALEPINVRSGPGAQYSTYGVVSIGTTAEVIGISEDGEWWVVKVSVEFAPDGRGWVNGEFVDVTNGENVPVIPTPPLGDVEFPPPGPDAPTALALAPINVRSGPSTDYPSYGIAPTGSQATVVGVSEDGAWWIVSVSTQLAPDGQGWVSADFVEVTNADDVPVVPAPPVP